VSCPGSEPGLNVIEAGPTEGALVILLHGTLAEARFRLVALDQRGHGQSEKPRGIDAYEVDRLTETSPA
jgi:epoxide hydrolase 4